MNQEMVLDDFGSIADECWRAIPEHFPNVELDAYVVMPNHVHGIIVIKSKGETCLAPTIWCKTKIDWRNYWVIQSRCFKTHRATGIWQRNYYKHIIGNDKDLQNKMDYINANPLLWDQDDENPLNIQT